MSTLPPPLTPRGCDLRALNWFPMHHKRLRQSSFWKRASDLACRISVDLWCEAYEQVPAASLPDDDYILAEWAGFGRRDMHGWLEVKTEVMSAWTLCSDGRWYHPTLAEVACEAFVRYRQNVWQRECDRIRKANARARKDGLAEQPLPPKPSDDPFVEVAETPSTPIPEDVPKTSAGCPADKGDFPADFALTGTGTGTGTYSLRSYDAGAKAAPPTGSGQPKPSKPSRRHAYPPNAFELWYSGYPHKVGRGAAERAFQRIAKADAVAFEILVAGLDAYIRNKPADREWCNPATWLHQERWTDQPARASASVSAAPEGGSPRIEFGSGVSWPVASVRNAVDRWRSDPSGWPLHALGPPPGQPGCRVPDHLLQIAA